ncbi:metal ABC transporter permease [Methyloceanibacter sp.]|jgi:manganese/iron transport system permease protein|uniref:metal ABC transporter permease n=1 Tax=Methyloceanibacter sp. TaxID=1965321 RepID=UPI0035624927
MIDPIAFFTEPFAYDFMQRAVGVSLLVAAVCAVLSCYLVLKGWSLMGDAISHAVLPGIVIAFVLGIPLVIGAFVAGLACALATGYLKDNSRVKEDTVMGIVFSGMFGFGLVLFTKVETDQHLNHILFGNMLGVTAADLIETAIIAGGTLLIVLAKRRDLLLYCFDPNHARAIGLPVRVLHYGLLVLLSLTIVSSIKAVGIILVIAMLIAPGATAYLLTDRFERMLVIAVVVACTSAVLGTFISFHIDGATGACIVLVQAMAFFAAFLFAPKRGLLAPKGLPSPTPTGGGAPAPHGLFGNPRASLSAFGSGGSSAAKSRRSRPSTSRSA